VRILNRIINNPDSKTGVIFGVSSIASGVVAMVVGIIIIRWIEPGNLGIWQSLSVLQLYIPFLELGVPNGLNRELPYLYGQGKEEEGIKYAQSAQYFMILVAALLFVVTIIALIVLLLLQTDRMIVAGVVTVGMLLTVNAYQRFLTVTYRSSQSFLSLSRLYWIQMVVQIGLLPLVWLYEYYGLLLYSFLIAFIFTISMHIARPIKEGPLLNKNYLKHLIAIGLPVFGMGYIRGISNSFNRIVLLLKGGALSVGLFTPVSAISTLITMLPGVLGNFFFPRMNHILGASNDPVKLWPVVVKINLILFFFSAPFIAVVWWSTPYLITTYFEKYKDAIGAMQLFSINFLFSGTLVSHNVIYAVKAYTLGYIFVGAELFLRFLLPYLFVTFTEGNILTSAVYGVLVGNLMLFVLNIWLIKLALKPQVKNE
jgi:O-antigen/teichoic acid export membrane protein